MNYEGNPDTTPAPVLSILKKRNIVSIFCIHGVVFILFTMENIVEKEWDKASCFLSIFSKMGYLIYYTK